MNGLAALLIGVHGVLLRRIVAAYGTHCEGLGLAVRRLARGGVLQRPLKKLLRALDSTVCFIRHVRQALRVR